MSQNKSFVVFARSVGKALEKHLSVRKHKTVAGVTVFGEDSTQTPRKEWPDAGTDFGVMVCQGSEAGKLQVVGNPGVNTYPLLIVEMLTTDPKVLSSEVKRILDFLLALDITPLMEPRETDYCGTIGKHFWCVRDSGEEGFLVFVDDRPLRYQATLPKAQAYAKQIIARIQADGDYYLYDKPAGFLPMPKKSKCDVLRVDEDFNVRIVRKLDIPLVEFYDARESGAKFGPLGQFISRYFCSTILENDFDRGLSLDGSVRAWDVSPAGMQEVKAFIRAMVPAANP